MMLYAQGDLSEHAKLFMEANYVECADINTPIRVMVSFIPGGVSPKTLMPFTHLEVFSDSTLVTNKSKRAKHWQWEWAVENAFPQKV